MKIVQTNTFRYEISVENSKIKNIKVPFGTAYWLIKDADEKPTPKLVGYVVPYGTLHRSSF